MNPGLPKLLALLPLAPASAVWNQSHFTDARAPRVPAHTPLPWNNTARDMVETALRAMWWRQHCARCGGDSTARDVVETALRVMWWRQHCA